MRVLLLTLLGWGTALFPLGPALAASTGTSGNGAGCLPCHGVTPNGSVVVMVTGPDEIAPGDSALFTAWIAAAGDGAGIDIALDFDARAAGWTLEAVDGDLRPFGVGSLLNSAAHAQVWAYDFEVVAPWDDGMAALRIAMMAFNGDGDNSAQDVWNTTTTSIAVPEPAHGLALAALAALLLVASTSTPARRGRYHRA